MVTTGLSIWHDGYDWVIAKDPADADEVWKHHIGDPHGQSVWTRWEKPLRILDEDTGAAVEWTPEQWIRERGRGYLASTER